MMSAIYSLAEDLEGKNALVFYGFNSRMLPDSVQTSRPVYRKLAPRSQEELALLEKQNAKKKRKSSSVQPYKSKFDEAQPKEKKQKGRPKGKKTEVKSIKSESDSDRIVDQTEIEEINAMLLASAQKSKEPDIQDYLDLEKDMPLLKKSKKKDETINDDLARFGGL